MSTLDQLRQFTTIVADTSDFEVLKIFALQDGTTNPSHILNAAQQPKYQSVIDVAVRYGKAQSDSLEVQVEHALLRVLVGFGSEILKCIPGRVSTEVDAIHSFDKDRTVQMAREIIELFNPK